jgi:hypothetical protein
MTTTVVNIRSTPYDVYIGRAGKGKSGYFGNPFRLGSESERDAVIAKYRIWFYERIQNDIEFKNKIHQLKGLVLGCFCSPKLCHGHVIAEYLDSL